MTKSPRHVNARISVHRWPNRVIGRVRGVSESILENEEASGNNSQNEDHRRKTSARGLHNAVVLSAAGRRGRSRGASRRAGN